MTLVTFNIAREAFLIFYYLHYAVNLILSTVAMEHSMKHVITVRIVKKNEVFSLVLLQHVKREEISVIYWGVKRMVWSEAKERGCYHSSSLHTTVHGLMDLEIDGGLINEWVKGRRWWNYIRVTRNSCG